MVRKELSQNIFLKFRPKINNHGKAVYEIRSFAAVWNQHEVLNVINTKEDTR